MPNLLKDTTREKVTFMNLYINKYKLSNLCADLEISKRTFYKYRNKEDSEVQIKYVYNCDVLNVRKKLSTQGTILITVKHGTMVTVYEISGSWARIGANEWCSNKYLSDKKPTSYVTKTVFNCTTLNIRNKPSLLGKKIGTLKKGAKVKVYSTSGTWAKISQKEEKYCSSKYLK